MLHAQRWCRNLCLCPDTGARADARCCWAGSSHGGVRRPRKSIAGFGGDLEEVPPGDWPRLGAQPLAAMAVPPLQTRATPAGPGLPSEARGPVSSLPEGLWFKAPSFKGPNPFVLLRLPERVL